MGTGQETSRTLRVVLDTNVIVSALVFRDGRLAWLRAPWSEGRIVPVVCRDTVAELVRVLAYPKFGLDDDETKGALAHYMEHAEVVDRPRTARRLPLCRDPADRMFLQLAYTACADALVTGDADLLAIAGKSKVAILTPEGLKQRL